MTVYTVTVHDAEHPQILDGGKIFCDQKAILINLSHLGNKSSPSFVW